MGKNKMPERWLEYRPFGGIIHEARIAPIKTPLNATKFATSETERYRWTPYDVLSAIPNVGLVIDITNKFPAYYDTEVFKQRGVDYVKIACVGAQVPTDEIYFRFWDVIRIFNERNKNNNRVIAVHCTHGVNRTGYLICRYLVEDLGFTPYEALEIFARKRGYPVERENYFEAIEGLGGCMQRPLNYTPPPYPYHDRDPYPADDIPPYPPQDRPPYPSRGRPPYGRPDDIPPYPQDRPPYGRPDDIPPYPQDRPPYPSRGRPAYPANGRPPYPANGRPPYPANGRPPYHANGRPQYNSYDTPVAYPQDRRPYPGPRPPLRYY